MHRVKQIHKLFYLAKKKEKKLGFNDCDCMFPQMLSGLCGLELRWFFLTEYSSLSECHSIKKSPHKSKLFRRKEHFKVAYLWVVEVV